MSVKKKFIFGNWKMAQSMSAAKEFLAIFAPSIVGIDRTMVEVGICPTYPQLFLATSSVPRNFAVGAQDCSTENAGAFTGEVSASSIKEIGCDYVLIGHSERRVRAAETSQTMAAKLSRALEAGLTPIYCCGETETERNEGKVFEVLKRQIEIVRSLSKPYVLAYEPVWAIGTGRVATLGEIAEVHRYLASELPNALAVQYGGSVKAANAKEILSVEGVGGLLVGGASLKADEFEKIVKAAC